MANENIRFPKTETIVEEYRDFAIVDNTGGARRDGTLYARQRGETQHSRSYGTAGVTREDALNRLRRDVDEYEE